MWRIVNVNPHFEFLCSKVQNLFFQIFDTRDVLVTKNPSWFYNFVYAGKVLTYFMAENSQPDLKRANIFHIHIFFSTDLFQVFLSNSTGKTGDVSSHFKAIKKNHTWHDHENFCFQSFQIQFILIDYISFKTSYKHIIWKK